MVIIDTNILLRYLLQDHNELSAKANAIIEDNIVICLNEVLYEVFHVLTKIYEVKREEAVAIMTSLFEQDIVINNDVALTLKTLQIMQETSMDFIDCLLLANVVLYDKKVISFDKKINNYMARLND